MTIIDKLLVLMAFLVAAASAMLYNQYRRGIGVPSVNSVAMMRLRQGLGTLQSKSRLDHRSSISSRNDCAVQRLILRLDPDDDNCRTSYIQTWGCRGTCHSYSQMDYRNITNIYHSCSCCMPVLYTKSYSFLACKNGNRKVPFMRVLSCTCRPCDVDDVPKDMEMLKDLLTKTAVDTPLPIG